jgi:hypothetical protein
MTRYTGPARGVPTHREIISDRAEAVIFILLAVVAAVTLYLE